MNKLLRRKLFSKYRDRIATSFFSAFIIIALIPILIGTTFYSYTLSAVADSEYDKTATALNQRVDDMDSEFRLIKDIMSRLMDSDTLNLLITMRSPYDEPNTIIRSMDFREELKSIYLGDAIIRDVLIYLSSPNMLYSISDKYSFTRPDVYYPYFLEFEDFTCEEWDNVLNSKKSSYFVPAHAARLNNYSGCATDANQEQLALFVWPLYKDGRSYGTVIFLLDGNRFAQYFSNAIDVDSGAVAWASTSRGEKILSCPSELNIDELNEENMFRISVKSKYNNLEYTVLTPNSVIYSKVRWLKQLIIWMVALSVVFGVSVAKFFSHKLGAPLDMISQNLRELYALEKPHATPQVYAHVNPVTKLGNTVNELIISHSQLKNYISRQINVVDQLFFEKLLGGYFIDEAQINEMSSFISQPQVASPLVLAIVKCERIDSELTLSEASVMSAKRAQAFDDMLKAERQIFETSLDTCVLIFSARDHMPDALEQQLLSALEHWHDLMPESLKFKITAAVSIPTTRYIDLAGVYSRCTELLFSLHGEKDGPIMACQRDMHARTYAYTLDIENQIINFTLAGNGEKVHELVQNAFGAGFESPSRLQTNRMLTHGICATLMRISAMLGPEFYDCFAGIENETENLALMNNTAHIIDRLLEYFDKITIAVQLKRKGRTSELIEAVKEYIDTNFSDPELTLSSAATHFSLTDAYLSRSFKECESINFSSYLEQCRINGALELIDKPIALDDIAIATGFDHVYNLRSAFKRVMGVTPSEYRKRVKNSTEVK